MVLIRRFLGAVQLLTVVPVRAETAPPAECAAFFPVVGGLLGLCGAGLMLALTRMLPASAAALCVLLFWVLTTGALHEDGVADTADAFRAHRTPEKILAILKDSRIGTFGGLALLFSVLLRWQGLANVAAGVVPVLVASQAVSRAALVALAWIARPAGGGMGAEFSTRLTTAGAVTAIVLGVAAAAACGLRLGWAIVSTSVLLTYGARRYFHARLGGVTGDCLGALSQAVETSILVVGSCASCSW